MTMRLAVVSLLFVVALPGAIGDCAVAEVQADGTCPSQEELDDVEAMRVELLQGSRARVERAAGAGARELEEEVAKSSESDMEKHPPGELIRIAVEMTSSAYNYTVRSWTGGVTRYAATLGDSERVLAALVAANQSIDAMSVFKSALHNAADQYSLMIPWGFYEEGIPIGLRMKEQSLISMSSFGNVLHQCAQHSDLLEVAEVNHDTQLFRSRLAGIQIEFGVGLASLSTAKQGVKAAFQELPLFVSTNFSHFAPPGTSEADLAEGISNVTAMLTELRAPLDAAADTLYESLFAMNNFMAAAMRM